MDEGTGDLDVPRTRQHVTADGSPVEQGSSAGESRLGVLAGGREVTITLSDCQLEQVVAGISEDAGLSAWLGEDLQPSRELASLLADDRLSRSLLRALLVFFAFPADARGRELTHVASELGISASTIHRYAITWMAVGMLAQDPISRRYRRQPRGGSTAAAQTPAAAGNEH